MTRRVARVLLTALLWWALLPVVGVVADTTASTITINHSPPAVLEAGVAVPLTAAITSPCAVGDTCEEVYLELSYIEPAGATAKRTVKGSTAGTQTLSTSIPADHARFPQVQYRLRAYRKVTGISNVTQRALAREVSASSPATGMHTVLVDHVIRFAVKDAAGAAVAGATVIASPFDEPGMTAAVPEWTATTNSTGQVAIPVDRTDPFIAARAAVAPNLSVVWVDIFNSWPSTPPAPGTIVAQSGESFQTGFTLNLGNPNVPAVSTEVQNATLVTQVEERDFSPTPTMSDGDCGANVCRTSRDVAFKRAPDIANNIGAGPHFTSTRFWMKNKASIVSTIGARVKAGAPWKNEGESTYTDTDEVGVSGDSGAVPSGRNMRGYIVSTFEYTKIEAHYGRTYSSTEKFRLRDYESMNVSDPHDEWGAAHHQNGREVVTPTPCDAEDVFFKTSVETETTRKNVRKRSYNVDAGTPDIGIVELRFWISYSRENTTEASYKWVHPLPADLSDNYYLYVRDGWDPQKAQADSYEETPYKAYTHWSTNPLLDLRDLGTCPLQG